MHASLAGSVHTLRSERVYPHITMEFLGGIAAQVSKLTCSVHPCMVEMHVKVASIRTARRHKRSTLE